MSDLGTLPAEVLDENRALIIDVLAEFFQDSLKEDPAGVGDWLARNGTSADLFIEMVALLRTPQATAEGE